MGNTYTAKDIQVLEGLDAVRRRPGMYIGTTSVKGLHHLLWEIVDNAIDEAANGYASNVTVTLHEDNSVSVEDDGRGVPVGIHPELKISGVEVVFTQLHAGGKFNNDNYAYSGGLHGVGASVVNALSKWMIVEVYQNGGIYRQEFRTGIKDGKLRVGKPVHALKLIGETKKHGTKVTFLPDSDIFDDVVFNYSTVKRRLRELAFLTKGVKINLIDERTEGIRKKHISFEYQGGLVDFVSYLNQDKDVLHASPVYIEGSKNDIIVCVAMQYSSEYSSDGIFSFVNNIPTPEGGMHEAGFKSALTKVFNEYARNNNILKEKDDNLAGEDYREGLCAVISLKMKNVQFEGQTKTKLGNAEAKIAVDAVVYEKLSAVVSDLNNTQMCNKIIEKAIASSKVREAARKAKKTQREKNKLESQPLVGKLAACSGRNYSINELYIVEGDSAGGSAKQGRDRKFQAILPLRGKPLNVEKKKIEQVLANEEFRSIITALGAGFGESFDIDSMKYDKIIILSDADQDGGHIRTILITFFYRYFRQLVNEGHLYIGRPPLYKISKGNNIKYAHDEKQLDFAKKSMGSGCSVQRYKGLGEMNPSQLWDTTMDPAKRSLIRVTIDDAAEAERLVSTLMGDKVEPRREHISEYANFNKKDNFEVNSHYGEED